MLVGLRRSLASTRSRRLRNGKRTPELETKLPGGRSGWSGSSSTAHAAHRQHAHYERRPRKHLHRIRARKTTSASLRAMGAPERPHEEQQRSSLVGYALTAEGRKWAAGILTVLRGSPPAELEPDDPIVLTVEKLREVRLLNAVAPGPTSQALTRLVSEKPRWSKGAGGPIMASSVNQHPTAGDSGRTGARTEAAHGRRLVGVAVEVVDQVFRAASASAPRTARPSPSFPSSLPGRPATSASVAIIARYRRRMGDRVIPRRTQDADTRLVIRLSSHEAERIHARSPTPRTGPLRARRGFAADARRQRRNPGRA